MAKKTKEARSCDCCGVAYIPTHSAQRYCPACRAYNIRGPSTNGGRIRGRKRQTGTQADIERLCLEAQRAHTTYGKWVARQWAEKNVRVVIPKIMEVAK